MRQATAVRARRLDAGELAWIAALPCAALTYAAMRTLGPPLAHALMEPAAGEELWPRSVQYVYGGAEPLKHARIAIALAGPLLLATAVLVGARRPLRLGAWTARALVLTSQLLLVAFVAFAVLGQNNRIFPVLGQWRIFTRDELIAALLLPLALLLPMRSRRIAAAAASLVRDTRARRIACTAIAAAATAGWLLSAVNTEGSIGRAAFSDLPPWTMADPLAILDGRTPLVNFYVLYGQVWAYVAAGAMYVFGSTITVFSLVMTTVSGCALLAVHAVLRRVTRSALPALLLYLPVLAIGFLSISFLQVLPANSAQIFSLWPIRYAGPYLLLWLMVRHLDGDRPRHVWPLFLVGGLVLVNNLEFGFGGLAGMAVALVCARPPRTRDAAVRLAGAAAGGLLGAAALVALVALVRSGELPDPGYLSEYPHVFGTLGFTAQPIPRAGFHLVVYATFGAALGTAAVRLVRADPDRLLTALLAWSGIFGLSAASYFSGRSEAIKLLALFSVWGFALALLVVVVVRGLAARDWRRPRISDLLVLAGFGLAVVAVRQLPTPWSQLERIGETTAPLYAEPAAHRFVAAHTTPGQHVAILIDMGQRIARDVGVVDVSPFAFIQAIATERQLRLVLDAVRREGDGQLFVRQAELGPEHEALLKAEGFWLQSAGGGFSEWRTRTGRE